jgi:thiol-disulfide isomerase/thioredoxin
MSVNIFGNGNNKVKMLTNHDFDSKGNLKNTDGLCTVMFYADWCGHCKRAKPIYSKISNLVCCQFSTAAVDCVLEKELASRMSVTGFPTFLQFKDGKLVSQYNGNSSESENLLLFICGGTYCAKKR